MADEPNPLSLEERIFHLELERDRLKRAIALSVELTMAAVRLSGAKDQTTADFSSREIRVAISEILSLVAIPE